MLATTKRQVLTSIACLFDPLGYLTLTTIKMRQFLQMLWNKEMDWDDPMNKKEIETWEKIIEQTKDLSEIAVPQYIGTNERQFICFCDASKNAYVTTIYLKTIVNGIPEINLIFAKARATPNMVMSIPRFELTALLIGVRCLNFVAKEIILL